MAYLLDTHILLWAASSPMRLGADVRAALEDPDEEVFVSAVSIAELMIKQSIGKLRLDNSPTEVAQQLQFRPLDLTWRHCEHLLQLPRLHRDPFDRMLIAQAIADDLMLVTHDEVILGYPDVRLMANH